jgi:hypothetical protein
MGRLVWLHVPAKTKKSDNNEEAEADAVAAMKEKTQAIQYIYA